MVQFEIDGERCEAREGETLLEVAQRRGIEIPTLCYHAGLEPYGACRLCLVEVSQRGRVKLEAACTRPVEDGLQVRTDTDQIKQYRRLIAELLLARCPESERVQQVARDAGVAQTRFEPYEEDCVLCGLCVRACEDAIGSSAISFVNRGLDRKVSTPFEINSDACIGCGACARVCSTSAIKIEDEGDKRHIRYFNTVLELQRCPECGRYFATRRAMEATAGDRVASEELRDLCESCRRQHVARSLRRHVL